MEHNPSLDKDQKSYTRDSQLKSLDRTFGFLIMAAIFAVTLMVLVLVLYFSNFHGPRSDLNADWGAFGDFLGGTLNPIFSLLAFFALIYTIKLQSIELRNSAEQLEKSAGSLSLQNTYIEKQNFESTFFNLIENYRRQTDQLAFAIQKGGKVIECNFNYLKTHAGELVTKIDNRVKTGDVADNAALKELPAFRALINPLLDQFFDGDGNYSIRLCKGIFFIIRFIDKSTLAEDDKIFYISILENQLTLSEITVLYFFIIQKDDSIVEVVKKYSLFSSFNLTHDMPCVLTDIKNSVFPVRAK